MRHRKNPTYSCFKLTERLSRGCAVRQTTRSWFFMASLQQRSHVKPRALVESVTRLIGSEDHRSKLKNPQQWMLEHHAKRPGGGTCPSAAPGSGNRSFQCPRSCCLMRNWSLKSLNLYIKNTCLTRGPRNTVHRQV